MSENTQQRTSWWTGRSGLVIPLVLAAFSTYLLIGVLTMKVPDGAAAPGPRFFPTIILVAGYIISALLVIKYIREPEIPQAATYSEHDAVSATARAEAEAAAKVTYKTFSDWQSVGWAAGGFLAFALLLAPLGWILSAALLFWCVARSMGSTKPVVDIFVGLTMSSIAYLAFDVLLGLNLPSGILGGF